MIFLSAGIQFLTKGTDHNSLTSHRNLIAFLTAGPYASCKEQYEKHK